MNIICLYRNSVLTSAVFTPQLDEIVSRLGRQCACVIFRLASEEISLSVVWSSAFDIVSVIQKHGVKWY